MNRELCGLTADMHSNLFTPPFRLDNPAASQPSNSHRENISHTPLVDYSSMLFDNGVSLLGLRQKKSNILMTYEVTATMVVLL